MTIRSALLGLPLVVAGWLGILVLVGLVSDEAPAQIVMFPSKSFMQNLPENAAILSVDDWSITLISEHSNFAQSLYRSGAMLVLPSGLQGCTPKA